MTREEIVRKDSWILAVIRDRCELTQAEKDYLNILIEVLEQEPTAKENLVVGDCISRQRAIDKMQEFIEALKTLPSIQPKTDVLDKIRAEIKEESKFCPLTEGLERALEIIDKHTAESECKE